MVKNLKLLIETYITDFNGLTDFLNLLLYDNYISEQNLDDNTLIDKIELSTKKPNYVILHKIIIKNRNEGIGSFIMNIICNWCDKHDKILCLTPDISFGGSSVKRLKQFYKRFGFIENKGRNIDFNHNESMYRPLNK